jgi:RNA polymerase sigma-70 factor (ECF subfamily)
MRATQDDELLTRAGRGDMDAFAALFEPLRALVFGVSVQLVGPDDAEDVVMETFLKAWRGLPRFDRRASLKTWVCRIARNCAVDMLRKRRETRLDPRDPDDGQADPIEAFADERQPTAADVVQWREVSAAVERGMATLSRELATTLRLRFSEGLSYSEIATVTGVSIGTVMSRIFNGRRRLMRALEEFR